MPEHASAGEKNLFVFSLFQTYVEAIYLNDDEALELQTSEDHHIFQWLKFQANRGTTEAEVDMNLQCLCLFLSASSVLLFCISYKTRIVAIIYSHDWYNTDTAAFNIS